MSKFNFIKSLLQWSVYFIAYLCVVLVSYITSPILPILSDEDGNLPDWLYWFQTPDATIDGDSGYQDVFTWITNQYIRRVLWIIRNPAAGFCWYVISKDYPDPDGIEYEGDIDITSDKDGKLFMWDEEETMFQWLYYKKYWNDTKYTKFRFGWKLLTVYQGKTIVESKVKFCFTFNPFKSV